MEAEITETSLESYFRQQDCINYCSEFFISTLPGADDAKIIKQSKIASLLANQLWIQQTHIVFPETNDLGHNLWIQVYTRLMQPIEFHTPIHFDFNKYQWLHDGFLRSKMVPEDQWSTDVDFMKYPKLRDSLGISNCIQYESYHIIW